MELIDSFVVPHHDGGGAIELYVGDLARIPSDSAVDALVISAFPDSYAPAPGTLIAALHDRGLSVSRLARNKEQDLRATAKCWLSGPLPLPELHCRHIICFEPLYHGPEMPAMVVGDLFRCLVPLTTAEPWISTVATPLVATGMQRAAQPEMLLAMLDAATHWMRSGLRLRALRIVLYSGMDPRLRDHLAQLFRDKGRAIASMAQSSPAVERSFDNDVFISYAHEDGQAVDLLQSRINKLDSSIDIYRDTNKLVEGSAWQQSIFNAIDASRLVLPVYSPSYLASKVCLEELHIGWMRHREKGDVLMPALLRSADLPTYMRLVQYTDAREADPARIEVLADTVVRRVNEARNKPTAQRRQPTVGDRAAPRRDEPGVTADSVSSLVERLASDGEINLDISIRLRDR